MAGEARSPQKWCWTDMLSLGNIRAKCDLQGRETMIKRVGTAVLAAAFVAVVALPTAGAQEKKALTPQQQKMKVCAAQWKDEKAKTGAKGRDAYRKFIGDCLKKA